MNTRTVFLGLFAAFAASAPAHAAAVTPLTTASGTIQVSTTATATLPFYDIGMAVVQDSANPLGGLTFIYQINNAFYDPTTINALVLNGFSGYTTDLGYATSTSLTSSSVPGSLSSTSNPFVTGTASPTSATDSSNGTVKFDFSDKTNKSTDLLVVQTNATGYTTTTDSVDPNLGGLVSSFTAYAPSGGHALVPNAVAAPEPAPLAVVACVGLGLFALTFRARRRGALVMAA